MQEHTLPEAVAGAPLDWVFPHRTLASASDHVEETSSDLRYGIWKFWESCCQTHILLIKGTSHDAVTASINCPVRGSAGSRQITLAQR